VRRAAVALVAVAALGLLAGADGGARPVALTDAIAQALEDGRTADAYAMSKDLVELVPDDPNARYIAAISAMNTVRDGEALEHIEAGLAVSRDDIDLLGLRAGLRLGAGDEAGARADAERALAIDPQATDALAVRDELEVFALAGARLDGKAPDLQEGSPVWFVDQMCEQVANGVDAGALESRFSLEMLSSLPPEQRTHANLVAVLRWALGSGARAGAAGESFAGWWVEQHWDERGGLAWVTVRAPYVDVVTESQVALFRRALADPDGEAAIDPGTRAIVEGVPPDQREELLRRMVGSRIHGVMDFRFVIRKSGGRQQVTDLIMNGISVKTQLATMLRLGSTTPVTRAHRDERGVSRIGLIALLVTIPGVLIGAVLLGLRNNRRRISARRGRG
jgi:hypothetical protein